MSWPVKVFSLRHSHCFILFLSMTLLTVLQSLVPNQGSGTGASAIRQASGKMALGGLAGIMGVMFLHSPLTCASTGGKMFPSPAYMAAACLATGIRAEGEAEKVRVLASWNGFALP